MQNLLSFCTYIINSLDKTIDKILKNPRQNNMMNFIKHISKKLSCKTSWEEASLNEFIYFELPFHFLFFKVFLSH